MKGSMRTLWDAHWRTAHTSCTNGNAVGAPANSPVHGVSLYVASAPAIQYAHQRTAQLFAGAECHFAVNHAEVVPVDVKLVCDKCLLHGGDIFALHVTASPNIKAPLAQCDLLAQAHKFCPCPHAGAAPRVFGGFDLGTLGNVLKHGAVTTAIALLDVVCRYATVPQRCFEAALVMWTLVQWAQRTIDESGDATLEFTNNDVVLFGGAWLAEFVHDGVATVNRCAWQKFPAMASSLLLLDCFDEFTKGVCVEGVTCGAEQDNKPSEAALPERLVKQVPAEEWKSVFPVRFTHLQIAHAPLVVKVFGVAAEDVALAMGAVRAPEFLTACAIMAGVPRPVGPSVAFPSRNMRSLGDPHEMLSAVPSDSLFVSVFGPWTVHPWEQARDVAAQLEHVVYALAREEMYAHEVHLLRIDKANPIDFARIGVNYEMGARARDAVSMVTPLKKASQLLLRCETASQFFVLSSFDHEFHSVAHMLVHRELTRVSGMRMAVRFFSTAAATK